MAEAYLCVLLQVKEIATYGEGFMGERPVTFRARGQVHHVHRYTQFDGLLARHVNKRDISEAIESVVMTVVGSSACAWCAASCRPEGVSTSMGVSRSIPGSSIRAGFDIAVPP